MKTKTRLAARILLGILVPAAIGTIIFYCANFAQAETAPHIIINEIQTAGTNSNDEFIEFFNPTDTPIDLEGYKLIKKTTGGSENTLVSASKFSGVISAQGYFLIAHPEYKDEISADLAYSGSTYYISNDNTVLLYDQNGALLDKAGFGTASDFETALAPNPDKSQSIERKGFVDTDDNAADFSINVSPSPQNSSAAESDSNDSQNDDTSIPDESESESDGDNTDSSEKCNFFSEDIKINELFPYPETGGQEFVELKNFGAYCVDLSSWKIMDEKGNKYVFAPGTTIEPGEFWHAEGNFYLNNTTAETLYLFDPSDKEINKASYEKAAKKYSFSSDGQDFFWTSVPTPGAENIFDVPEDEESANIGNGDANSETANATNNENININEIMPNPKSGSDGEYIEIVNGGSESIDLIGWRLKDSSKNKGYQFKEHIILKPGEFFVIYRTDSKIALNNSNESVYLHDPRGNIISSASFEKSQKGASFNLDGKKWKWSKFLTPGKKNQFDSEPSVKIKKSKRVFKDIFAEFSAKAKDKETKKLKYAWDFGDGKKSSLAKTSHKYLATGKYTVVLSVTDDSQTIEKRFKIEVKKYPRPDLEIVKIIPNPSGSDTEGEIVELKNNSARKIELANWKLATGSEKIYNHPISGEINLGPNETKAITREISKFSLNNKSGIVQLVMPDGKVTDAVEYQKEKIAEDEAYVKIRDEWQWIAQDAPAKTGDSKETDDSEDTQNEESNEQPGGEILGATNENAPNSTPTRPGYTSEDKFIFYKIFGLLEYKHKESNFCPVNPISANLAFL